MKILLVILGTILVGAVIFSIKMSSPPDYVPLSVVIRDNSGAGRALQAQQIEVKSKDNAGMTGISVPEDQVAQARAVLDRDWQKSHYFMSVNMGGGLWKHYDKTRVDPNLSKQPIWDALRKASDSFASQHDTIGRATMPLR